jgi:hypothetical protein
MLLRLLTPSAEPNLWTAQADVRADREQVLEALTSSAMIARWAPVSFDVERLVGGCLRTDNRARVSGSLAGMRATFDIEVLRADSDGLELTATGPISFDVAYRLRPRERGTNVEAFVSLRRQGGLAAQVLRAAASALLNAGALGTALRRLDASLGRTDRVELAAA